MIKQPVTRIMKQFVITASIISVFLLTSCDRYNYVHYIVDNNTTDSLRITYSFATGYFDNAATDTSFTLNGNHIDTLCICEVISPHVYDPEPGSEMTYIFNFSIVRFRDNAIIKKDVASRKNWSYHETGNTTALMELTIDDSDFLSELPANSSFIKK